MSHSVQIIKSDTVSYQFHNHRRAGSMNELNLPNDQAKVWFKA